MAWPSSLYPSAPAHPRASPPLRQRGEALRRPRRRLDRRLPVHRLVEVVRVDVPVVAARADQREAARLGPEVRSHGVVDVDHVGVLEADRSANDGGQDALGADRERDAELAAEPRRPRPGRHDHPGRLDAPAGRLDRHDAIALDLHRADLCPLPDGCAQLLRPAGEAPRRGRRVGVPAPRLVRRRADVGDLRLRLQVLDVARADGGRFDADAAEHLDVPAQVLGVLRRYDHQESGAREPALAADGVPPVPEELEALPGQAGVPFVRVMHPDQRARPARRPRRQRRLLHQERPAQARLGERVHRARPDHAPADHHRLGRRHASLLPAGVPACIPEGLARGNRRVRRLILPGPEPAAAA